MTDAERRLWYAVRARRFESMAFRRQAPIGPFIVDFFCPEHRLIVELDGGQHGTDEALRYDAERSEWLAANGYRVMRFWNRDVLADFDGVLERIREAVGQCGSAEMATSEVKR